MLHNLIRTKGDPMVNTIHDQLMEQILISSSKIPENSAKCLLVCMGLDWCEAQSKCKKYKQIDSFVNLKLQV